MENIQQKIARIDWKFVSQEMHDKGYSIIHELLSSPDCKLLISNYGNPDYYRKTITMERYRFGLGEYKYFSYPLPGILHTIRKEVYTGLAPIANTWMDLLHTGKKFPGRFEELQKLCHNNHQTNSTVLILKYGKGGHNTLHQDLYGNIFFPIQGVLFLNEPDKDYSGGEFVLMQQTPRAQSRAIVLKPKKGDMLLFTTNFRPIKGTKGYYRANMKHGVSEIHEGERHTVGVIFHDALN